MDKELFVHSVRLLEVGDHTIIPTLLLYDKEGAHIGYEAIERCDDPSRFNVNFKIDLGKHDARARVATFETATGRHRTAYTLSRDFMRGTIEGAQETLKGLGLPLPKRVLVAEPIAMGAAQGINDNWLSNYRNSNPEKFAQRI